MVIDHVAMYGERLMITAPWTACFGLCRNHLLGQIRDTDCPDMGCHEPQGNRPLE